MSAALDRSTDLGAMDNQARLAGALQQVAGIDAKNFALSED